MVQLLITNIIFSLLGENIKQLLGFERIKIIALKIHDFGISRQEYNKSVGKRRQNTYSVHNTIKIKNM